MIFILQQRVQNEAMKHTKNYGHRSELPLRFSCEQKKCRLCYSSVGLLGLTIDTWYTGMQHNIIGFCTIKYVC